LSEYNCERPHESLNNMTPEEYRQHHYLDLPPVNSASLN
ncbi:transposase, partial [Salmonella enterica]|nr:transposase [Salmonella enterica]